MVYLHSSREGVHSESFKVCALKDYIAALDEWKSSLAKQSVRVRTALEAERMFWASNSCLLRWDTQGIFSPDPTAVLCLTPFNNLFAVGISKKVVESQDTEILRIFRSPCLHPSNLE